MPRLVIGNDCEHVAIELPESLAEHSDSEGWMQLAVEIAVEGFTGRVAPWFEIQDFARFLDSLDSLRTTLTGTATLAPIEEQIALAISGNGRGLMSVSGRVWSRATYQNDLRFSFDLDQTYLAEVIDTLRRALVHASNPGV